MADPVSSGASGMKQEAPELFFIDKSGLTGRETLPFPYQDLRMSPKLWMADADVAEGGVPLAASVPSPWW